MVNPGKRNSNSGRGKGGRGKPLNRIARTLPVHPTGYQVDRRVIKNTGAMETFTTKRFTTLTAITTSTTLEVDNSYVFSLANLPSYTDLTGLFDAYRIRKINLYFTPAVDTCIDTSVWSDARLYVAVDFDGATTPTISDLAQMDTCQIHDARKAFMMSFQPRIALAAFNNSGSAFTAYAEGPADSWVDCSNASTEHYGVYTGITAQSAITKIHVTGEYFVEFKRAR